MKINNYIHKQRLSYERSLLYSFFSIALYHDLSLPPVAIAQPIFSQAHLGGKVLLVHPHDQNHTPQLPAPTALET